MVTRYLYWDGAHVSQSISNITLVYQSFWHLRHALHYEIYFYIKTTWFGDIRHLEC